jgi:hypothetical protein
MAKIPDARIYSSGGSVGRIESPVQDIFDEADDWLFEDDDGCLMSLFAKIYEINSRGGRVVRKKSDGSVEEISIEGYSSGFSLIKMTYGSGEQYEYSQRMLAAIKKE